MKPSFSVDNFVDIPVEPRPKVSKSRLSPNCLKKKQNTKSLWIN